MEGRGLEDLPNSCKLNYHRQAGFHPRFEFLEAVTLFALGAAQPVLLQQPDQIHALLSLLCEWGWIKAGACEACVDPAEGA